MRWTTFCVYCAGTKALVRSRAASGQSEFVHRAYWFIAETELCSLVEFLCVVHRARALGGRCERVEEKIKVV